MIKNKQIIDYIRELAPEYLAHSWDNVGTLVGDENAQTNTVLVALELTEDVLAEAVRLKAGLVITHHPVIFKPVGSVNANTFLGRKIITVIKNDITVYSSHTNMDEANGGTNDILFDRLELRNKEFLLASEHEGYGMGRIGELGQPMTLKEFALYIKEKLSLENINFSGDKEKLIKKVGLCTGASSGNPYFAGALKNGCDVYITGDVKHHEYLDAQEAGLAVIDGTHFGTENLFSGAIKTYIEQKLEKDNITGISVYESKAIKSSFHCL